MFGGGLLGVGGWGKGVNHDIQNSSARQEGLGKKKEWEKLLFIGKDAHVKTLTFRVPGDG